MLHKPLLPKLDSKVCLTSSDSLSRESQCNVNIPKRGFSPTFFVIFWHICCRFSPSLTFSGNSYADGNKKCQMTFIWLVRLGPTNDRLLSRDNNKMRSIETTIKSWHATCKISPVSKNFGLASTMSKINTNMAGVTTLYHLRNKEDAMNQALRAHFIGLAHQQCC